MRRYGMVSQSDHLDKIVHKHNRVANLQVAFADIEKYSRRRSLTQIEVIDAFTDCFRNALNETARHYIEYTQNNDVNFQSDVITLPTGDGSAVVFSFDGLHDIHLYFAKMLLKEAHRVRQENPCGRFLQQGWCNCHAGFNLRLGLAEGKGIIYHDVNDGYNVAGGVINMASRVMGLGDSNQILFTEEAFRHIIDMVNDPNFIDHFIEFKNMRIKHDLRINVYQFVDRDLESLNSDPPTGLVLQKRSVEAMQRMRAVGFSLPDLDSPAIDREAQIGLMETISNMMLSFGDMVGELKQLTSPNAPDTKMIDVEQD
jgi:class 3 adenylate cyclase